MSDAVGFDYLGPGASGRFSTAGGGDLVWSRDGRELFYVNGAQMMAVDIETDPTQLLSDGGFRTGVGRVPVYDVSADGQRFLMVQDAANIDSAAPASIILVQNWFEELRRLVPTN